VTNGLLEPVKVNRLGQVLGKAGITRLIDIGLHSETAERNSKQAFALPQFPHQLVTASVWQTDVADKQVEIFPLSFFDRLTGGMRDGYIVTAAFEHHFHSGARIGVIVHDEKPMPA